MPRPPARRAAGDVSGDAGAAAVEHALLLAAVAALLVVVLFSLGNAVTGLFQSSCDSVAEKAAPAGTC